MESKGQIHCNSKHFNFIKKNYLLLNDKYMKKQNGQAKQNINFPVSSKSEEWFALITGFSRSHKPQMLMSS